MSTRLLLVEDDLHISDALVSILEDRGFSVTHVSTMDAALSAPTPDLVLLDLTLPDTDGLDLCKEMRSRSAVPIIAVTARGSQQDRVDGLKSGADDYVVKPFSIEELIARIEAVLRRTNTPVEPAYQTHRVGTLTIDERSHRVTSGDEPINLTRKEFELLTFLVRNQGRAVGRPEILEAVWHTTWEGNSRTVDVHIAVLRQKLDDPELITTVRGVGYRLEER